MPSERTRTQAELVRALIDEYTGNRAAGDWNQVNHGEKPKPFQPVLVRYKVQEDGEVRTHYSTDWLNYDGTFNLDGEGRKVTHWAAILPVKEVLI